MRETGDPGLYGRADALLRGVLAREPRNAGALVERAGLALSRHDFRLGLELARRAQRLEPAGVAALPPLVDALVELGRHDEAERTLQRLVDRKPNLSAYARVSYLRELRGDLAGAASALALASAAGGPAAENVAAIEVLRGDLALVRGRRAEARRAYAMALALVPAYAPAEAGRARLAAFDGDLRGAVARWRRLVARLPLPEYAIALGEAELAAGRVAAAREDLALVRAEQGLLARAGVNSDAELALFEADHGDRARAVRLARRAWAAAPGVRSADALGWALTRAGRPREGVKWAARARRLGSADPLFAYHAGVAARAAGDARGRTTAAALRARARAGDAAVARANGAAAAEERAMRRPARTPRRAVRARVCCPARRMRTRSATSPSTTSPRCRSRRTGWTCATCSTRPRSRRSSSAGWRAPRCCGASAPRSRAGCA